MTTWTRRDDELLNQGFRQFFGAPPATPAADAVPADIHSALRRAYDRKCEAHEQDRRDLRMWRGLALVFGGLLVLSVLLGVAR